jgi:hypothetical protein
MRTSVHVEESYFVCEATVAGAFAGLFVVAVYFFIAKFPHDKELFPYDSDHACGP